ISQFVERINPGITRAFRWTAGLQSGRIGPIGAVGRIHVTWDINMRRVIFANTLLLAAALSSIASGAEVRLNGRTFALPDGFELELAAGPPLVDRPIVADFDQEGRLYVADSSGTNDNLQKQLAEKPHRIV